MARPKKVSTKKKSVKDESELLAELAIKGIQEKKGKEIVCIDLRNIKNTVVDFFVVCHAESTTQVDAIARSVEETIREAKNEKPWHSEGFENAEWILIDYVSIVVHVFREDRRWFYNIEKLWADAEVQKVAASY